jgi:glycosyltransferase involved in cell wall biosynthesis
VDATPSVPSTLLPTQKILGFDLQAFFETYPLRAELLLVDIHHLTSQTLATLLVFQRFRRPVVVSVLDIIPYLVGRDRAFKPFRHPIDRLFYQLAIRGLRKADRIVAISHYTKRTLVEALDISPERIDVVYPTVDPTTFRPSGVSPSFLHRYGLREDRPYVLFVGSEDPRKNLSRLLEAFRMVRERLGDVELIKVGAPHFVAERRGLVEQLARWELTEHVVLLDQVPEQDLCDFYRIAKVFVMPSLYEGFGLPAAEAMACGTPVVCSDRGSLPEVVGDAGLLVDPTDVHAIADQIVRALSDAELREHCRERGLQSIRRFNRPTIAKELIGVYKKLL